MYRHSKLYSIISYITWVGWVAALILRDEEDTLVRRHLNQALAINCMASVGAYITRRIGILSVFGELLNAVSFFLMILGIVRAAKGSEKPLPVIGNFTLIQ